MTYSIVARDPETGELGVGVQSAAFRSGAVVPWAMPGVGAVATQAYGERSYGVLGLELLRCGKSPDATLRGLLAADPLAETRQVAILDADGTVAVHTGSLCISAAGHVVGDGFSAQANCVDSPRVWEAMAASFGGTDGSLGRRLLAALDAAETAGGDWRGRQAAGLLVVPAQGAPWETVCDIRVDDHPEPLSELRRLLDLQEAYEAIGEMAESAAVAREAGMRDVDVRFAEILDAAQAGELDRARSVLFELIEADPRWRDYFRFVADAGHLPHADRLLADDVTAS